MDNTTEILLQSGSGTEALRRLIEWRRQTDPKCSYAWIAKQLGYASKGHIADILGGRRVLVKRLWEPCMQMLNLKGMALRYCKALLEIEERIVQDQDVAADLYKELETLRKILKGQQRTYSEQIVSNHIILQVHSAFGLYQNQPTRRQLIQFFGRQHVVEVDRALQILTAEGIVERRADCYLLKPEARNIMLFDVKPSRERIVEFLQQSLELSKQAINAWIDRPDLAGFRSSYCCVDRKTYESKLPRLREEILRFHTEVSQEDGDMLIHLDFQVYPIGEKKA